MLYEISQELGAALRRRGVPDAFSRVVYGPERTQGIPAKERLVFQRQGENDDIGDLRSVWRNPASTGFMRWQSFRIRVHAQSTKAGARIQDHERRCDHVVDRVMAALKEVVYARHNDIEFTGAGFVRPEDMQPEDQERGVFNGVCYEIRGRINRGVLDFASWPTTEAPEGGAAEEAVVGTDFDIATALES